MLRDNSSTLSPFAVSKVLLILNFKKNYSIIFEFSEKSPYPQGCYRTYLLLQASTRKSPISPVLNTQCHEFFYISLGKKLILLVNYNYNRRQATTVKKLRMNNNNVFFQKKVQSLNLQKHAFTRSQTVQFEKYNYSKY